MDFSKLHKIKAMAFDIDGVLTDGNILITDDGQFLRTMNMKDGYAVLRASQEGYKMVAISGAVQKGMRQRLNNIGIKEIHDQTMVKIDKLKAWIEENGLKPEEVMYMGDDCIDAEPIDYVGWGVAPNDAVEEVIEVADYVCKKNGGAGAVREAIMMVMKLQEKW
jgi:3-deoxy-D-manno-octulosonate 8-phosphate phosphatase (KDO 8-P phosphatase)